MPFKSKAQQKFMYANKPKGVNLQEWSDKTNFKKLPEHAEDGKPFSGIQDALRQEQPPVDADELAKQQADAALVQPHHEIPPEEGEELPETSLENLEAAKQNKIIDRQEHPTKEKMLEFVNSKRAAQGMPLMKVAPNLADEPQSMDSGEEYQKRKMEILKRMAGR